MKTLNKIYTNKEYMAQGFTVEEIPLIKEHDELYNKYVLEGLTTIEKDRMFHLIDVLGL